CERIYESVRTSNMEGLYRGDK
ncbi:DUF2514 domain-containing protein, partial [Salmonella enterica subsp. enterica serovar Weltevreden]|nr:DUF2514 domain-containing protein [Salmonella enterica subsp. enterica serovar Weltevreden]EAM8184143.1 DUF2514 domain-containing protein [Salmonella enterica]ECC9513894.1 DUF2514 domain-containing protein [Salmonella enterica subsp. enterica]EAO3574138.1 DUF2514 domain-containing protein [Salmonella enterica]EAQ5253242.1 DUF2514 domain-containing protein [Salmonella enterica]